MKPKYYSCFFLSLFACDQGNRDSSNIDVVNNFCKGVKDINDKNDPLACVELTTKLGGEYASCFWSLERCQGIVKQLCELVPSYPSQIVYDVLYALLKNKCLGAAGVRTITQGIKDENPTVFSLLNNYVEKKFKTCNQGTDDYSARIIAESFGFIFNDTISIPGINTFTSTPIPPSESAITVNDLTDIWQCVRFIINNNEFDTNSLKKLIKLASSVDFNEAIKAIADAGIFFKYSGDIMMDAFDRENVNLNDAGLEALANCIQNTKPIATTQNVKHLIPSLQNCKYLAPIFNKCINGFIFDDFITLLNHIDLDCTTLLDPLAESLKDGSFKLECLIKLINKYKGKHDTFNKVLAKINDKKFTKNEKGDKVILAFKDNEIPLEDVNLKKILSMISDMYQISNCQNAIVFCYGNIKNHNKQNIEAVFKKVEQLFSLNDLETLLKGYKQNALNKILPDIPDEKLYQKCDGNATINKIKDLQTNLDANTIHKVLLMISTEDMKKIGPSKNTDIVQLCYDNKDLDITKFIDKCRNFKFDIKCLKLYKEEYRDRFNTVLTGLEPGNFDSDNEGDDVLDIIYKFTSDGMYFNSGNLKKILYLCKEKTSITNVDALYTVFSRSRNLTDDVGALSYLVKDNSLDGYNFISKIDSNSSEGRDAQVAFVKQFYNKIRSNTIYCNNEDMAGRFLLFTYILYKEGVNLNFVRNKMNATNAKNTKKFVANFIKKNAFNNILDVFYNENITDYKEFGKAFNTALGHDGSKSGKKK